MSGARAIHVALVAIMFSSVSLSGCIHDVIQNLPKNPHPSWYNEMVWVDDPESHVDSCVSTPCVRPFWIDFLSPDDDQEERRWEETSHQWAVFGNAEGGNCCEHYLAATKEGWLLNFGGEYPTWSEDRGHTWQEYRPSVFSQFGCMEPKPTVPGQEGLGEGSIIQATNGDIISMGWFPYPSTSGADQFYAFFYDADDEEWSWCFNRTPEPFYDRSWQVEVIGPINGGIYGNGPWASLVISNFWHQVQNIGGQISTDGLNYEYFGFPDRDANLDIMEVDLDPSELGPEWDFTKPHKEMRAFPVPSGGLYFPDYFIDGRDAFLDSSLNWWTGVTIHGNSLPSQYCSFDSSTALHCVIQSNLNLTHMLSWDGGASWQNNSYDLSPVASSIEEWEFHSNGVHDLLVLNARYQASSVTNADVDVAWHVRDFSESLFPDSVTFLGQGDLDSTSGAGNDIRFDFASMGILPDGGSFIAYQDSTDPDPLFSLELLLPSEYLLNTQE